MSIGHSPDPNPALDSLSKVTVFETIATVIIIAFIVIGAVFMPQP